jgi:hypothetical protein
MDTNKHEFDFSLILAHGIVATGLRPVSKFAWKDAAQRRGYSFGGRRPPLQKNKDCLIADSLFRGLGVKRFSHLLIEGVAFAFRREPFVF